MGLARNLLYCVGFLGRGAGLHWSVNGSGCREKHSRLLTRWAWPETSCILRAFWEGVQGCFGLSMSLAEGRSIAGHSGDGLGQEPHVTLVGCQGRESGCRAALVC